MKTIEIAGHEYLIGKLDAFAQFHVQRRLAPILTEMGISVRELAARGVDFDNQPDDVLVTIMSGVMRVISKMSDEDSEYVLRVCCSVVRRKDSGGLQNILTQGRFQYDDINMQVMVQLAFEVCRENLSGFFSTPLGGTQPGKS